jgi:hypothetical protein
VRHAPPFVAAARQFAQHVHRRAPVRGVQRSARVTLFVVGDEVHAVHVENRECEPHRAIHAVRVLLVRGIAQNLAVTKELVPIARWAIRIEACRAERFRLVAEPCAIPKERDGRRLHREAVEVHFASAIHHAGVERCLDEMRASFVDRAEFGFESFEFIERHNAAPERHVGDLDRVHQRDVGSDVRHRCGLELGEHVAVLDVLEFDREIAARVRGFPIGFKFAEEGFHLRGFFGREPMPDADGWVLRIGLLHFVAARNRQCCCGEKSRRAGEELASDHGGSYSFTAPAVRPCMKYFCVAMKSMAIGRIEKHAPAIIFSQSCPN